MNHIKGKTIWLVVILVCLIAGIFFWIKNHAHKPVLNPNPKNFIYLTGTIAAQFKYTGHLIFIMEYMAMNPSCSHSYGLLESLTYPKTKLEKRWIYTDKYNQYKIRFAMDKYLPGYCDWQPYALDYDFTRSSNNYGTLGLISVIKAANEHSNAHVINRICNKPDLLTSCNVFLDKADGQYPDIRPNQSYHLVLNFLYNPAVKSIKL